MGAHALCAGEALAAPPPAPGDPAVRELMRRIEKRYERILLKTKVAKLAAIVSATFPFDTSETTACVLEPTTGS